MPTSVQRILNDGVGMYDVAGAGRAYEYQEGVQNLLLVSISSLYTVALFGRGWLTVLILCNLSSYLAVNYDNTFLQLAALTTLLVGQISIYLMDQGT